MLIANWYTTIDPGYTGDTAWKGDGTYGYSPHMAMPIFPLDKVKEISIILLTPYQHP
jgi:hypothetical protein